MPHNLPLYLFRCDRFWAFISKATPCRFLSHPVWLRVSCLSCLPACSVVEAHQKCRPACLSGALSTAASPQRQTASGSEGTHTHSLSHTFWTRTFFYFQTVTFLKVRRFLEGKLTVGWSGASPHHTLSQLVGVDVRLCFTQAAWTADSHTPLTKQVSSRPAFIRKGTKRNCGSRERKNKLSLRASPLLVREKNSRLHCSGGLEAR